MPDIANCETNVVYFRHVGFTCLLYFFEARLFLVLLGKSRWILRETGKKKGKNIEVYEINF